MASDPITPPEEWSPEALSLLDTLWRLNTTMLIVRRRLHPLLGFYASPAQVMEMVHRTKALPVPEVVPPRTVFEKGSVRRIEMFGFAPPPREDNPVRLVAPGTHSKRGFTMLKEKP